MLGGIRTDPYRHHETIKAREEKQNVLLENDVIVEIVEVGFEQLVTRMKLPEVQSAMSKGRDMIFTNPN